MIFFIPDFFLLEDSLPAGVHGTCLPSLPVVVVAPFLAFAGHGGGAVESDAGVAVGGARILRVGLPDAYITHGTPALLHEEVGFTGRRIAERVEAAVAERSGVA